MIDLSQIFKDINGNVSNVRAMSFLSLFYAFFINTYALVKGDPNVSVNFEAFVGFLTAAFAPKVYQRFAENKGKEGGQTTDGQNPD